MMYLIVGGPRDGTWYDFTGIEYAMVQLPDPGHPDPFKFVQSSSYYAMVVPVWPDYHNTTDDAYMRVYVHSSLIGLSLHQRVMRAFLMAKPPGVEEKVEPQ